MRDDERYSKPMTDREVFEQEIRMYIRDKIINPIMPPVKTYDSKLGIWLKARDATLIKKLTEKHVTGIMAIIHPNREEKKL